MDWTPNNGTSDATPWQSISKINSSTFLPGDQILFKSGQEFYGKTNSSI